MKLTPLARFAYVLAAAVIVIDQASKWWVTGPLDLAMKQRVPVLPPIFNLSMVWNRGVSFGMLTAKQDVGVWALALLSAVVAVALVIWARKLDRKLPAVAIGLVVGGAVGNLIDRVRLGAVVDFLDFSGLYFPWVFNIADSAITIGIALLVLDSLLHNSPSKPEAEPKS